MRTLGGWAIALLLLSGCGDSGSQAEARLASQVCDEVCGWPDECFTAIGVPAQGSDCVRNCEAQAEVVGFDCITAISSTFACLGTCDVDSLTDEELLDCQDEALAIEPACE